jgi:hypothetical protein
VEVVTLAVEVVTLAAVILVADIVGAMVADSVKAILVGEEDLEGEDSAQILGTTNTHLGKGINNV